MLTENAGINNAIGKKALFLYVTPLDTSYQIVNKNEYDIQLRPKLGLLYLASILKMRKKISCEIWDQTLTPFGLNDIVKAVNSGEYLFVGFYSAISLDGRVIDYIKAIRAGSKVRIPIIIGGPSFPKAESFLRAGCDIVCNGEGEETICQIADFIGGSKTMEEIKGITYIQEGRIIHSQPQPLIEDINSLPFPDYSLADFDRYCDYYIFTMRKPYTTMITSRGCPFDCIFCDSHTLWGRRYRVRDANNVLAEIDELVKKYKIRYIAFQDDVFGMDYDWTSEFCSKLKSRKYDLRWMCILHPFSFKKDPGKMLGKLRSAGCDLISLGLQSAHPEMLKRLDRHPEEPECLEKLVRTSRRLNMLSLVSFIFGSPGETRETIKTSIDFALRVKPNYARFYNMVILAGSRLAKKYGFDAKLCELTNAEIDHWCHIATRKFYLNPQNFSRNIYFILRNNPSWFFIGFKHLLHLIDNMGLMKKKG